MKHPIQKSLFRAAAAGAAYFGAVFAIGFVLGTLRVFIVMPAVGETAAVAIELPVILTLSWLVCRWLIVRVVVAPELAPRLVMGGLAFGMLMAAELGLSAFVFGRTFADHLAHYRTFSGLLGLAGQIAFAAFPALPLITNRRR
ncbi:MAG: hypothetical protein RIM72_00060 [Alphaproteobacteria bacterium]